ncbi:MAG: RNA methyltransferase [Anaerolineales bacterium]|nr:RNA methyltransferase [Anaerolineales bacterium]
MSKIIAQQAANEKQDVTSMLHTLDEAAQHELIAYLSQFLQPRRRTLIPEVLDQRTRYLTVVLENVYQPHNASAVLRSCECFGVQDVHIIEKEYSFRPNTEIVMGASKWLTLHQYREIEGQTTQTCLNALKAKGYRLVATTLHADSIPLHELPLDQPVALCFGTEKRGLSQEAHDLADLFVKIPMSGFTQSFNISVTAALFLYDLTNRLRTSPYPWQLTAAEKQALALSWYVKAVTKGEAITQQFLQKKGLLPST